MFARVRVYAIGAEHLAAFFADMAVEWRGWTGAKSWTSLEGEAKFAATADGKGHVTLRVRLEPSSYPRSWIFEGNVMVEAGQLERLAADVHRFVKRAG